MVCIGAAGMAEPSRYIKIKEEIRKSYVLLTLPYINESCGCSFNPCCPREH